MNLYEQLKIVRNGAFSQPMGHKGLFLQKLWDVRAEVVIYYETPIIKAHEDGRIVLDNGGYWIRTTQVYMNEQLSRIGWKVIGKCSDYKHARENGWKLIAPDKTEYDYANDVIISPDNEGDKKVAYALFQVEEV